MNKKIIILILCIGMGIFFVNHHLENNKKNDANINDSNNRNEET